MRIGNCHTALLAASLCLGATLSQPLLASSIRHESPVQDGKLSFKVDDESQGSSFGKHPSENARLIGSSDTDMSLVDEAPKPDWTNDKTDRDEHEYKWENSQSHLNDDKWEDHKNGIPGPIDNLCASKYCEMEPPAAVPVPAAAWLLGSGLLGLFGLARSRSR